MNISGLFQFVIGFFFGLIFFTAGIAGGAYFFLNQTATNPEKQVFSEEKPKEEKPKEEKVETTAEQTNTKTKTETTKQPEETAVKPEPEEKLPNGAYFARVTWSTGLSLRDGPSKEAERIGGVGFDRKIIILSTSNDGDWQKIRIPGSEQEGWVKAGNIAKVTDE